MRTSDEIMADAEPRSAFSNHSQFSYWADGPRGCYSCRNDDDETEKWCPILGAALLGVTPREWTTATAEEDLHGNYTCTEYDRRPDDDGGDDDPEPEPEPPPVIVGQVDIFEVFAERIVEQLPAPEVANA